ncbi:MAG TPA: tetratricopeptide repeat protein, partial [Opitutaceae bacterium]|nr:tetratricopeptide repeat protein [Opitutaceae bacterium]
GTNAALFCLFYGSTSRYEFEFLPALLLLAVLGIFGLERTLAGRPRLRGAARAAWACLLVLSLAYMGLQSDLRGAQTRLLSGSMLSDSGLPQAGIAQLRAALRMAPSLAQAHNNLANAYLRLNLPREAEAEYNQAIRLDPSSAAQRYNLGNLLVRESRAAEAVLEYQAALQLDPNYAEAHYNLAVALFQLGRSAEAAAHYREALRLRPDMDPRRRQAAPSP